MFRKQTIVTLFISCLMFVGIASPARALTFLANSEFTLRQGIALAKTFAGTDTIDLTGSSITLTSDLTLDTDLILRNGTLNLNNNDITITIPGDYNSTFDSLTVKNSDARNAIENFGTLTIQNSNILFNNNRALYNFNTLNVNTSTFDNNGIGITSTTSINVTHSVFTNHNTLAIELFRITSASEININIEHSVFHSNNRVGNGVGSVILAVLVNNSTVTLTANQFYDNTSPDEIFYFDGTDVFINRNVFYDNTSPNSIFRFSEADVFINNSVFAGNDADRLMYLDCFLCNLEVAFSTFADNNVNSLFEKDFEDDVVSVSVVNSILMDGLSNPSFNISSSSFTYNLSDVPITGTGNVVGDPLFANPSNRDYALSEGSPAIDSAKRFVFNPFFEDVLGNPRTVDDVGIAQLHDSNTDKGAYEFQFSTQYVATATASDNSASENGDTGEFTVDLYFPNRVGEDVTVNYSLGGTATSGRDYMALSGSVVIPQGQQTATIDVIPLDDEFNDDDESIILTITSVSNPNVVFFNFNPPQITITDNDETAIVVTPPNGPITEGATGAFTIALATIPDASVPISIVPVDDSVCTVSPETIKLSDTTPITISITAVDDSANNQGGFRECQLTLTNTLNTTGAEYRNIDPDDVRVPVLDSLITPSDVIYIINRVSLNDLSADFDGDNDVDNDDVNALLALMTILD